jgi:uncharacterized membrane protein
MELRCHIAERVEHGQALDDVLRQLGDPLTLAESYLAAVPLQSARPLPRLAAKLIDGASVIAVVVAVTAVLWVLLPPAAIYFLPAFCVLACLFGFVAYTTTAEYQASTIENQQSLRRRTCPPSREALRRVRRSLAEAERSASTSDC